MSDYDVRKWLLKQEYLQPLAKCCDKWWLDTDWQNVPDSCGCNRKWATASASAAALCIRANNIQARCPSVPVNPWTDMDTSQIVAQFPGQQPLRSSSTSALAVPLTRLCTIGDWAFPAIGSGIIKSTCLNQTSRHSYLYFCIFVVDLTTVKWLKWPSFFT